MAVVTREFPVVKQQGVMRVPSGGAQVGGQAYTQGNYGSSKLTTGAVGLSTGGALLRDLILPDLVWGEDIHQIVKAELVWRSTLFQFGSYGATPQVRAGLLSSAFASVGGQVDRFASGANVAVHWATQPNLYDGSPQPTSATYPRTQGQWLTLDVTAPLGLVAPARVLRKNGTPGGGLAFHGFRIFSANEADAAFRWEYQGMRTTFVPFLRLTFEDRVPPERPQVDSLGPSFVAGDPPVVASGGGGRLEVNYLFTSRAGDTHPLVELEIYSDAATDATPGNRIRTTGAIPTDPRTEANAYRVVIQGLPTRTTMRYRLRVQNQQAGNWSPWTPLADGRFRTAYQPQTPLDPRMTSDTAEPHIFLTLNSPNDPGDFITGFTGLFVRHNPDGTTTNLWPTLSRIDIGGATTRVDIPWGGVQLVDGDRVSWRGALYNRDGILSPLTAERTVVMQTRVGPSITPADTTTKLLSRTGPLTISDTVEFDAIRVLLYRGDALIHDSGQVLAGPDTSVTWSIPAGLVGWGETIGVQAQTRATGTSVFGSLSNRSAFYVNSLPTTTLTASDGDGFTGTVLPTQDIAWHAPYTDPDVVLYGETPAGKELELRVGATPQGTGALIARRSNTSTILADERTGRRLDALTSTSGWPVDTDVTATTAATQPTGYSGNSASIQATGGSSTNRGARSTVSTADLDLGEFGDGTLIRIWRRITSNTNLTRWVARFEFATTSDWAEYDLAVTGDAVDTWVEQVFAKAAPARTNGTVDWSLWSGKVFYRVVVSGAYTGSMHVRDLRIGAIATDKTVPDGGVTWESNVDARVRYHDGATPKLATTLAADSAAAATNVKLTSVTNLNVGDELTLVKAGFTETRTISTVGTAGAGGTGVTVSEAYTFAHTTGDVAAAYHWGTWSPWLTRRASQPPAVAIVSPGGSWAEDAFGRTVADSWGTADEGGAWTLSGTAADYDVAGGKGTVSVAASTTRIAALLGASILDTDVSVTFRTDKNPSGSSINVALLARASAASDTSYIRGRARINADLSVTALVECIDGGSEVGASSVTVPGLTFAHSTDHRIRLQAIGTNPTKVRVKVWAAADDEPEDWAVTLSNSTAGLQDAGAPGIRPSCAGISNGPVLFSLDDFRAAPVIIDPTPDLVHSYSSPSSKAQSAAQPIVYRRVDGQDQLLRDALVPGDGTSSTLPSLLLRDGEVYAWQAVAYDSDGLPGMSAVVPFLADFTTPEALPEVRGTGDAARSAADLDWARTIMIGASTSNGPSSPSTVEAYEAGIEHAPLDIVSWFLLFGAAFPTDGADWCADRGSIPMIAWEPWESSNPGTGWSNADITSGAHNADIDLFADGAAAWGGRVLVRLMHEFNGSWVPWGLGSTVHNGNTPASFVAAWRHVVDRCRARGATNIEWVWCPNVDDGGPSLYRPLADLYPGDEYVDWVAMDGYNFGSVSFNGWEEATTVFGATYDVLVDLAPSKPVMVAETGCAPTNMLGDREEWIATAKVDVPLRMPRLRAWVYFEFEDTGLGIDWRLLSDAGSLAEYVDLVDTWTDPLAIVDPFLDHFRVYRWDPEGNAEVRIDGGPEAPDDGRPKLTDPTFEDFGAHLGTNRYRVTAHNGAQESDAAYVEVALPAARSGSWMIVTPGQDRYTFPVNPTSAPRTLNGTVETFRVPGNRYPTHLHWGAGGRTVSMTIGYVPTEDGPLNVLMGELLDTGTPVRIKAPEGYVWQDMDAKLVDRVTETPREHGLMDLAFTADEIGPEDVG